MLKKTLRDIPTMTVDVADPLARAKLPARAVNIAVKP
jgi:hypothetical protein